MFFSFNKSLISVNNNSSFDGSGGAGGVTGFLDVEFITFIIKKIEAAMIKKLTTLCINDP